ncbi:MAG: DUF3800 domain-containing protein [Patescibacteria group bacterium]
MKTLFIDESGDLGTKERYFVMTMLAPQKSKRISNFMRKFCAKNTVQEVKASQLSFPQKTIIFNKLCSANDYTVSYIVADKLNIDNKKILEDKNLCYNYLFSFLVKKTIKSAREDIMILLDNHSTKVKSINSLADYIKIKAYTQWGYTNNLNICYVDSKSSKIVQATDVVSNAIYAKYTYKKDHFYKMLTISESIKFPYNKFGSNPPVDNLLTP